ncbi:trypsin-like serine protease [Streptomyces rimosus]|uniref:S1 family peptidase n=1 Tax=Streptomyces rimosus TaxID=1927 RepID=UPI00099B9574|nr:serine protease [Streptomyces rimosus]
MTFSNGTSLSGTPGTPGTSGRRVRRLLAGAGTVGAVTVLCAAGMSGSAHAIVGGKNSTEEYPFMVSIPMTVKQEGGPRLSGVCGGALIDRQWVVTAAHCAQDDYAAVPAGTVRIGSDRQHSGGTVRTIVKKVIHPRYDISGNQRSFHDIALLRLDRPVTRQAPIRMAAHAPRIGAHTRLLGFGTTVDASDPKDWKFPERLKQLDTLRAPTAKCLDINGSKELCTQSQVPGAMACMGDSGGPQIQRVGGRWQLVGTTSGDGEARVDPKCGGGRGIYTSIASYKGWIDRTVAAHR